MLPDAIATLIRDEQSRQANQFIQGIEIEAYLLKLGEHAEILSDSSGGRCRGFVAFYCNDKMTKRAFITSVLVDPRDRGLGIARALVTCVLDLVRRRGFTSCRLEVAAENTAACAMYRHLGFHIVENRPGRDLLEIQL